MPRSLKLLGLCLLASCYCLLTPGQSFTELLDNLSNIKVTDRDSLITGYITDRGGLPIIQGDSMIFLAHSNLEAPKIKSGFNGFLNPRYVTDPSAGAMTPIHGTSWYYLIKQLKPDARIFYQIQTGSRTYNDPLNPLLGFRFGLINSEARMPGFEIEPELVDHMFAARGRIINNPFHSRVMDHQRTIHIYLPAGYDNTSNTYPMVFFHDGTDYLQTGQVARVLDNLIHNGRIAPLIAVFDDPVERGKEYRGDPGYIRYIDQELLPWVEENYRIMGPEQRAVLGGSRGGQSALFLSHHTAQFDYCGVFSPAIHPTDLGDFGSQLTQGGHKPKKLAIIGALYDGIWHPDAVGLTNHFQSAGRDVTYLEISQGHHIQGWVAKLEDVLITLLNAPREEP